MKIKKGLRVRLASHVDGPPIRTGTVVSIDLKKGGALVQHDRGEDMGPPFGPWQTFGWAFHELRLEAPVLEGSNGLATRDQELIQKGPFMVDERAHAGGLLRPARWFDEVALGEEDEE